SGYRPGSTVVFLATSGEEFGYTDSYYEWIVGAWWAARRDHPDWAGQVRAFINLETMALKEAPLTLRASPELKPWLEALTARSTDLLAYGAEILTPVASWNDQWTFTAAGVPSFKINVQTDAYDTLYHSNLETQALVDFDRLAKTAKWIFRAVGDIDGGLLPYSLKTLAADLAAAWTADGTETAGADPAAVLRAGAAIGSFGRAAAAFEAARPAIPAERIAAVNAGLLAAEKTLNTALVALAPAEDDATVFPYQPVLKDLRGVEEALKALGAPRPDTAAALKALTGVYLTRLGIAFSHPVYLRYIARLDPAFERIHWGAQGHLPKPLDVVPEYRLIEAGRYVQAAAGLRPKREALAADLSERLSRMAEALEQAAASTAGLLGKSAPVR
ncbi:MAG TPA: M28 family peptidase, partial [Candidatus Bathyarchaeia archaeon]|nr:M28 family peptidase [Candidatus Bathyarchaeia archaeon]